MLDFERNGCNVFVYWLLMANKQDVFLEQQKICVETAHYVSRSDSKLFCLKSYEMFEQRTKPYKNNQNFLVSSRMYAYHVYVYRILVCIGHGLFLTASFFPTCTNYFTVKTLIKYCIKGPLVTFSISLFIFIRCICANIPQNYITLSP